MSEDAAAHIAALERRVDQLEAALLQALGAMARLRLAPDGRGPAVSWTVGVESIAAPLLERRKRPVRQMWLEQMSKLT